MPDNNVVKWIDTFVQLSPGPFWVNYGGKRLIWGIPPPQRFTEFQPRIQLWLRMGHPRLPTWGNLTPWICNKTGRPPSWPRTQILRLPRKGPLWARLPGQPSWPLTAPSLPPLALSLWESNSTKGGFQVFSLNQRLGLRTLIPAPTLAFKDHQYSSLKSRRDYVLSSPA